jgi:hypothetical protein
MASLRARRVHCSNAACLHRQFLPQHQRVSQPIDQGEFHRSIVGGTVFCGTNCCSTCKKAILLTPCFSGTKVLPPYLSIVSPET